MTFKSEIRLIVLVIAFLFLLPLVPAKAAGPAIGPLCVDGVKETQHPDRASTRDDGTWIPISYSFDRRQSGKAFVLVFDRPITPSNQLESCAGIKKRMIAAGAHMILSGRIRSLKLEAQVFSGPSGNRIQINPGDIDLVLASVDSGVAPLAGGFIDFRGSHLWVKVTKAVLASTDKIEGEFQVEAYNRRLVGVHVALGGGLTYKTDLTSETPSNSTFNLDLANGQASLWSGKFVGLPKVASTGSVLLPFIQINEPSLPAEHVEVEAVSGDLKIKIAGLRGSAKSLSIAGSPLTWLFQSSSLKISRIQGKLEQSPEKFLVASAEFFSMVIDPSDARLGSAPNNALFQGRATATFANLSEGGRSGTSDWTAITSPTLSFLTPGGISRLSWTEEGRDGALTVSGKLDIPKFSFGGIELTQPLSASLARTRLNGELVIPIKLDLPAAKGEVSFLNGDQTVKLQGRLDQVAIDGRLVISVADLASSRFEADANAVNFALGAAVSVSPVIAGAKANFLDAEVEVTNSTPLRVSSEVSQGTALLSTDVLILAQPVFKIGDNGTARQATVDLRAEGAASIYYDLGKRSMGLARAKLRAQNVTFNLIGDGSKTIDLGGTLLTDPTLSLKQLVIEVDKLSEIRVQYARIEELSVGAGVISKLRSIEDSTSLTYSGTPTRPLTLASAQALQVNIDDDVALSLFNLVDVEFAINNASIDFGSGMTMSQGEAHLKVGSLIEAKVFGKTERQISSANVAASGQVGIGSSSFSVNGSVPGSVVLELSGPEKALNGSGTVDIGSFSGNARSVLKIGYDCRDTHHLDVDMESNFAVGGAQMNLKMANGKLGGDAAIGPLGVNIHSTRAASCSAPSIHHVVSKEGEWWTDGVCNKGLKFYHCRWESPEVAYTYHIALNIRLLTASTLFTNPHVYLNGGKFAVCNVGAVSLTGVVAAGGYTPGIESNYPGLDNIVNGIIQFGLEPVESLATTAIGNGVGWLVTSLATQGGNVLCLGRPL